MPDRRIIIAGRIAALTLFLSGAGALTHLPFWARCLAQLGSKAERDMAAACAAGPPVEAIDWILLALLLVAFPATIAWMGYLHAGLIRTGRLVSVIPAWVAALSWIVPVLNLVLPYHLLLRYARAMSMHRGLVALIGVLWVIDVVFYAAMAVPAIAGDLPVPWRIRAEFLDSLLGPVGLILTGVLVIRFSRRAAQI